jgi:hypothetical protein
MNESTPQPDPELDTLFALARARRPDTSAAEFAFETRLMARLRAREDASSVWAMVSWRLIPFFAVCVVGLTILQAKVSSETSDAATIAGFNNPVAADMLSN